MLELNPVPAEIIGCFGGPEALDQISGTAELSVRVAPDELLVLLPEEAGAPGNRSPELQEQLDQLDGAGLALDLSSGYAAWALRGEERFEAFSRLSAIKLPAPPAAVQGLVAHVPAKVIVRSDVLIVMVSSVLSHHIRERVLRACADLRPVEGGALQPAGAGGGEREPV
ncbi:MAG TPA: hypothetical protein VKX16_13830 [Chloroflexota bacterium]|nr:hypothetical protein [Chloroflexota bacterium]